MSAKPSTATLSALASLQQLQTAIRSANKVHVNCVRTLQNKLVGFESTFLKVLNLERTTRTLVEQSATAADGMDSKAQPAAGSKRSALFEADLIGYARSQVYTRMLKALQRDPAPLARAIAFTIQAEKPSDLLGAASIGFDRRQTDSVSRGVVHDLFGALREKQCLLFFRELLTSLHGRASASGSQEKRGASSFTVLEFNSFSLKLLHEYNQLAGRDYLQTLISDTVHRISMSDDSLDLNVDLMGPHALASPKALDMLGEDPYDEDPRSPPPAARRSDPRESAQSAPAAQPVGQRLFSLCRALLEDLRDSLPSMPFGVRYLARLLVQLHVGDSPFFSSSSVSASASAGSTASSAAGAASSSGSDSAAAAAAATSPRAGDAKAVESKGETKSSATSAAESERERLVSDFLFLNWIVNGLMFPEPYLADCAPISQLARRNLQVIGTVLIKLMSGSRFSAYSQNRLAPLNAFLDEWAPKMQTFLRQVIAVEDLEEHYASASVSSSVSAGCESLPADAAAAASADSDAAAAGDAGLGGGLAPVADGEGAGDALGSGVSGEKAAFDPLFMLANDLFTVHRLLRDHHAFLSRQDSPPAAGSAAAAYAAAAAASAVQASAETKRTPASADVGTTPASSAASGAAADRPAALRVADAAASDAGSESKLAEAASGEDSKLSASGSSAVGSDAKPDAAATEAGGADSKRESKRAPSAVSVAPPEAEVVAACLRELGDDVPECVPAAEARYVLLDPGFGPLKTLADGVDEAKEWPGCEDLAVRSVVEALTGALTTMRPLRGGDGGSSAGGSLPAQAGYPAAMLTAPAGSLIAILRTEAFREQWHGVPAKSTVLLEAAALLAANTPARYRERDFALLLSSLHASLSRRLALLRRDPICARVLLLDGVVNEVAETLAARERAALETHRTLQIRRLLLATRPKIRAFRKFVIRSDVSNKVISPQVTSQYQSQQQQAEPIECGGPCPESMDKDRFLCTMCGRVLDRHRQLVRSFMGKYVLDTSGAVEENKETGQMAPVSVASSVPGLTIDLKDPQVVTAVGDYVIASAYAELFTKCHWSDALWARVLLALNSYFVDWSSFYTFMSRKETPSAAAGAAHARRQSASAAPVVGAGGAAGSGGSLAASIAAAAAVASVGATDSETGVPAATAVAQPAAVLRAASTPVGPASGAVAAAAASPAAAALSPRLAEFAAAASAASAPAEKKVRVPYFGTTSVQCAVQEIERVCQARSIRAKMRGFVKCRSIITAVLTSTSLSTPSTADDSKSDAGDAKASASASPSSGGGGGDGGNAEDYMTALCFVLLRAGASPNCASFLSNLQFVASMFNNSLSVKAFVDVCVAVKYLHGLGLRLRDQLQQPAATATAALSAAPVRRLSMGGPGAAPRAAGSAGGGIVSSAVVPSLLPRAALGVASPSAAGAGAGGGGAAAGIPKPLSAAEKLRQRLVSMGFADGDVVACGALLGNNAFVDSNFAKLVDLCSALARLVEMGFPRDQALAAIKATGPDISAAVQYLATRKG